MAPTNTANFRNRTLEPWDIISNRKRNPEKGSAVGEPFSGFNGYLCSDPRVVAALYPGLKLANAFGVIVVEFQTDALPGRRIVDTQFLRSYNPRPLVRK